MSQELIDDSASRTFDKCFHCELPLGRRFVNATVDDRDQRFCCYGCVLAQQVTRASGEPGAAASILIRLGLGVFCAMNVMLIHVAIYLGDASGMAERYAALFSWASLLLATPAVFISGEPFFRGSWASLRAGVLSMDVPVAVAIAVMYVHGFASTWTGEPAYLDSLTMLIALLMGGRVLVQHGRNRAAGAAEAVLATAPRTAQRREGDALVSVRDSGVGIPADMLPRVFDMFLQVDRSREQAEGGLGIGLSLVKALVEMHGGSVEARSAGPGRGCEFLVRLPVLPAPTGTPAAEVPELPRLPVTRRVLVVDDNKDAAVTLSRLLALLGNETQTTHSGSEALALAPEFLPDVVLLDLGMPKLNGYEVARRIREQPWGRRIVLVAMTGWGEEEARRRSQCPAPRAPRSTPPQREQ